ncbi:hypothetical protein GCM10007919_50490 [Rhizobium indigoferae]|nr:hypothetical protein GCM10007919_50490 [Rhizobium indigoferae]
MCIAHEQFRKNQKIDVTELETFTWILIEGQQFKAHAGSLPCNARYNLFKKHERDEVGKNDPEATVRLRWLERRRRNDGGLDVQQGIADRGGERISPWRWNKFTPLHYEQLVFEISAEPGYGRAHGRLAEINAECCSCNASFCHHSVERYKKIEIKTLKTHVRMDPLCG